MWRVILGTWRPGPASSQLSAMEGDSNYMASCNLWRPPTVCSGVPNNEVEGFFAKDVAKDIELAQI